MTIRIKKRSILKVLAVTACLVLATGALAATLWVSPASAQQKICGVNETPANGKCIINFCKVGQDPNKDKCLNPQNYQYCDPALANKNAQCAKSAESGTTSCNLDCVLTRYVNPIINFLAMIVGLVVTIVLSVAGIQYSSSAGDPQKAAKAKARISNAILALISFLFLWVFLQWAVPGGFL